MKALKKSVDKIITSINPQHKEKIPSTLDIFDNVKESYKFIKRPDGKLLSVQDKQVLATLLQLLKSNIQLVDYEWLEEKLLRSQRTIRRTLQNLGNCFNYKFHNLITIDGKKYFNKILIIPTDQLLNILADSYSELEQTKYKKPYIKHFQNPYKIIDPEEQKCPEGWSKVSTPLYRYKREQEKETITTEIISTNARAREETETKIETIHQKTLVVANLIEPPKVFCKEPPEPKSKIVKFMSRIEENPTGISTRSGNLHLQVANPPTFTMNKVINLPKPDDPSLSKLNVEIYKSFGSLTGSELIKHIKFIVLGKQKIGIRIGNIDLAEEEKNQLRACIRTVYGEDTKIVALGSKNIDLPVEKEIKSNEGWGQIVHPLADNSENPTTEQISTVDCYDQKSEAISPSNIWGKIRRKLASELRNGKYHDINWFSKLEPIINEEKRRLTLKAPNSFTKDYIFQNFLSNIEEIAAKYNFSVGLSYGNEMIYYNKSRK